MTMKSKKQSSVVLVYDRYYIKKPSSALQAVKKALYCTALTVCAMLFLTVEYDMPANLLAVAGTASLFTVFFCTVFSFVKKRFAIPAFVFFSGIIVLFNYESIWERVSYFTDRIHLRMNGAVFYTERYTFHTQAQLRGAYQPCADGVLLGVGICCCIFALITAACMFKKPFIFPSFFLLIILSAPVAAAAKMEFNFWIIPCAALYVGAISVSKTYSEGAAVKKGFFGSFRASAKKEERDFRNKADKSSFVKRASMNSIFYSKYLSSACWAAAIFTAAALILNNFTPVKEGFDYSRFYSLINSIGQSSGITSPFENGPVSQYFAAYGNGSSSLNIVSPGNGEQEILRVCSPDNSVYLRGDIGIDFTGSSWTSPIRHEPALWNSGNLDKIYRPAEMHILQSMVNGYAEFIRNNRNIIRLPDNSLITENSLSVDYLCQTDVVFLPAYTSEFGYFEDEMFDVYGDYVVRVNENFDKINTVKVNALMTTVNYVGDDRIKHLENFNYLCDVAEKYPMSGIFDIYFDKKGLYSDYANYVYNTYLKVPQNLQGEIRNYLYSSGLYSNVYKNGKVDIAESYKVAVEITDYLINNYDYSLDAKNDRLNPIMSFLNGSKSGHCALFASSMTLMMRELGVPARYCTGFVAPKTRIGQFAVLRSKNLHAWCEVFFDGIGWVTFDPTSSSVITAVETENNSSEEQSDSSESTVSDEESSESKIENSSNSDSSYESDDDSSSPEVSENDPDDNTDSEINFVPIILIALGVIIVGCAAAIIIVKFKKFDKQAKNALKTARYDANGEQLYLKIIAILNLCGYRQKFGEQPKKFFERADLHFKTKLSNNIELMMKLAFGKGDLTDEEVMQAALLLEELFNAADSQLVALGRVKLRKIILSRK